MECTVQHIVDWLEAWAPAADAESWDRVGLQIGDPTASVQRILVTLTLTTDVVEQARALQADLIVAHHPVLFRPVTDLRWDRPQGRLLQEVVRAGVAVYASHTNADVAKDGVNALLAHRLGLVNPVPLRSHPAGDGRGMGRVGGVSQPFEASEFLQHVLESLGVTACRTAGPEPQRIERVAVMGGSGASFLADAAAAGADAFVTSDLDFHDALDARELGVWTLDVGHFATERWIVPFWVDYLHRKAFEADMSIQVQGADEFDPFDFRQAPGTERKAQHAT